MKMRMLLIGDEERQILHALKENAERNVLSFDDMLDVKNGAEPPAGDRPGFMAVIPQDFTVVFSHENHPLKDGTGMAVVRHASFSVHGTRIQERCERMSCAPRERKNITRFRRNLIMKRTKNKLRAIPIAITVKIGQSQITF